MIEYILSLSYGKDSLACLGAIEKLRFRLEDEKLIDPDSYFRWSMFNDELQFRLF